MLHQNSPNPPPKKVLTSALIIGLREGLASFFYFRVIIYGLVFLANMWFVHPILLEILVIARNTDQTYLWIGLGIILVQALEPLGVWLKRPAVSERIRRWPSDSLGAKFAVGISQLSHIFLSMMVFLHVMPLFGIDGMCFDYSVQALPCLLTNLAFLAILGKEMVTFYLVLNMQKPAKPLDLEAPGIQLRETLGETLLLSFGMLMLTLSWSTIMTFIEPVTAEGWWSSLGASLILFLMLYPPSRLVFFAEEWLVKQSLLNRVIGIVFFVATLFAALRGSAWLIEVTTPGLFVD